MCELDDVVERIGSSGVREWLLETGLGVVSAEFGNMAHYLTVGECGLESFTGIVYLVFTRGRNGDADVLVEGYSSFATADPMPEEPPIMRIILFPQTRASKARVLLFDSKVVFRLGTSDAETRIRLLIS